ncbi:hypothetical protein GCM10010400_39940 [Streptomyces aculeolatus]|uniref:hypothetical protein n=1 Tax=Streptomyces aculeolatus TaxID=270689 RepID=UPI001CED30C8|nr:hypothetical protein [Streptomyces aculeolatus]
MTTIIQGRDMRTLLFGRKVDQPAKTVPQNALSNLFTITGGRIILMGLYGEVTTVIGGTTPSAKLVYSPASGTDTDLCTATAITSDAVNTQYSLPAAVGSALNVSSQVGQVVAQPGNGAHVLNAGTVDVHVSAADATGAVKWSLLYVPLDDGASVAAA